MNCIHMMTRICYFAVGMTDDLPPPVDLEQWLAVSTAPPPVTVKVEGGSVSTPKKKGRKTRSQGRMRGASKEPPEESTATSSEPLKENVDLEETQTDEEQREIKEQLTNTPAVSKKKTMG